MKDLNQEFQMQYTPIYSGKRNQVWLRFIKILKPKLSINNATMLIPLISLKQS